MSDYESTCSVFNNQEHYICIQKRYCASTPEVLQHQLSSSWLFFQMQTSADLRGSALEIFETQQQPKKHWSHR